SRLQFPISPSISSYLSMRFPLCSPFFLSSSPPPCSLHSFPTRRSSDLPRYGLRRPDRPGVVPHPPLLLQLLCVPVRHRLLRRHRSEEHTSELQSRFDLVCRLLLEKKKYKIYIYRNSQTSPSTKKRNSSI